MTAASRSLSVFVNCPFDPEYKPIADAIAFTVLACGFTVRSAAEIVDSGELRLTKIIRLIECCGLSIHDLSRVELDAANNLPRFNMPLELGIALGMKYLGRSHLRDHAPLVLDSEKFRYQKFASDLAGVDISAHANDPGKAILKVRNFLVTQTPIGVTDPLPGGPHINMLYSAFESQLPAMAEAAKQEAASLEYIDRLILAQRFLESLT